MVRYGAVMSFYIQGELAREIDELMASHRVSFKSRSHFINSALMREVRRLQDAPMEVEV